MEDNKIKQRIVGGCVLLALAVIFIPMVLDFRKDYDQVISGTNIPPKPKDFRVETFELNPEPQLEVPRLASAGSVEAELKEHPLVQQKNRAASQPEAAVEPHVEIKPIAAIRPAVIRDGWAVQVGSFGNKKNATGLRDKIRKRGFTAFVDTVNVKGKESHRVRIGPEADKERAQKLLRRLQQEMGLKGLVIRQQ